jgi:hypothetical protein
MDAKSFAQVALRLLAVFMIFAGLVALPAIVLALKDNSVPLDSKVDVRLYIASLLFPMILGVVIWMISPRLARWMVGKSEASGSFVPLDVTRLQTVAFVVLGTWLAIKTLSQVLVFAANAEWSDPFVWQQVVGLALSLCLIAGAKSLARLAQKVREFGAAQDQK